MLDPLVRRLIDPPLDRTGAWLARRGVGANALTGVGLVAGLGAVPLLAGQHYVWALAAILANRLFDGLDGAVARHTALTDFGGYFDIVADMIFYAAVVLGFALSAPGNAVWAALLLAGFMGTGSVLPGVGRHRCQARPDHHRARAEVDLLQRRPGRGH